MMVGDWSGMVPGKQKCPRSTGFNMRNGLCCDLDFLLLGIMLEGNHTWCWYYVYRVHLEERVLAFTAEK